MHAASSPNKSSPRRTAAVRRRRRWLFAGLVAATVGLLAAWLESIIAADGFALLDAVMVAAFAVKASWVALMFWNALIGFACLHGRPEWLAGVFLPEAGALDHSPAASRTAIAMTVCNEEAAAVVARLKAMKASLDASAHGQALDYFLLSDSSHPAIVAAEEAAVQAWRAQAPDRGRIFYRRRPVNDGAQHGNLRDFCERFGERYDIMVVIDADSLMTASAVLRLVRIMRANPRIGMLQSLNMGILAPSLFARVFELGHRHGMRCGIVGATWWQAERGQYRGHNAAIRVAPYTAHCRLADLPGPEPYGGITFCHDQIEGALMHRAGYEIWELPEEDGAYEGLPPTVLDFTTRYDRWFQGNLKNLKVLGLPGLTPMDRYHLLAVLHRFLGWPAFVLFVLSAAVLAAAWPAGIAFPSGSGLGLYAVYLGLYFAPRALGILDAALRAPARYGGTGRLVLGGLLDIVVTVLFVPVAMVTGTGFMIAWAFGHKLAWDTQRRAGYRLAWTEALRSLWPQTLFGVVLLGFLAVTAAGAIPWFLPFLGGLVLSVPFAVVTASPDLAGWAARRRICALPEEIAVPREIADLRALEGNSGDGASADGPAP